MRSPCLSLAFLIPLFFTHCSQGAKENAHPNILWITCEDMSPTLGCYGDPYARTPNIDQLATRSVRYTHAFSVAGVCAPSRSCLITGMYPSSLGTHHMRCTGTLPDFVTCFTEPLRKAGYYCSNNVKTDYNFKHRPTAWDESSNKAHWKKRKDGQPFFSVFNFVTTHESQIRVPKNVFEKQMERIKDVPRHNPDKANLPPFFPDTPIVRRDYARHADLITSMDKQVGDLLKELEDDKLTEDTIVFFYSDHGMGLPRGKRWLYDTGMRVPLLIHFPKKFEKWASGKPGTTTDRLVSFVDFGPTVQSLVGIKPAKHIQGIPFLGEYEGKPREYVFGIRDRMDERYDFTRAVRDQRYKYIRNYMPHIPWAQPLAYMDEMPTMQEWRRLAAAGKLEKETKNFLEKRKPREELYDTEKDPHELNNLADLKEHGEAKNRLQQALHHWQLEFIDLGYLPENELHDRFTRTTPYEAVRANAKAYPLARLMEVTNKVEFAHLKDEDSAIRFWAVQDFGSLRQLRAEVEKVRESLRDTAPSVRVATADRFVLWGHGETALPVLREALKHENEWVRLATINVLDRMGEKAKPALEDIRKAMKDSNQYVVRVATHALRTFEK